MNRVLAVLVVCEQTLKFQSVFCQVRSVRSSEFFQPNVNVPKNLTFFRKDTDLRRIKVSLPMQHEGIIWSDNSAEHLCTCAQYAKIQKRCNLRYVSMFASKAKFFSLQIPSHSILTFKKIQKTLILAFDLEWSQAKGLSKE